MVIECNQALAIACKELINNGTSEEAYAASKQFLLLNAQNRKESVLSWLTEVEENKMIPYNKNIGYCKIAFQRSFYHLMKGSSIEEAFKDALRYGGDTDTNAAIIGMVLGARDGLSKLP